MYIQSYLYRLSPSSAISNLIHHSLILIGVDMNFSQVHRRYEKIYCFRVNSFYLLCQGEAIMTSYCMPFPFPPLDDVTPPCVLT